MSDRIHVLIKLHLDQLEKMGEDTECYTPRKQCCSLIGQQESRTPYHGIPSTGNFSSRFYLRINHGHNVSRISLYVGQNYMFSFCVYDCNEESAGLNMNNNSNHTDSRSCGGKVFSSRSVTSVPPTCNGYLVSSRLFGSTPRNTPDVHGLLYRSRNTRRDRRHSLFDVRPPALSILSTAEGLTEICVQTKQQQLNTLSMMRSTEGTPVDKCGQETVLSKRPSKTPIVLTGGLRVINTGTQSDLEISGSAIQNVRGFRSGLGVTDSSVQTINSCVSVADVIDRSVQTIRSFVPGADVTDSSVQTINRFVSGLDVSSTSSSQQIMYSFQSDLTQVSDLNSNKRALDVPRIRKTNEDISNNKATTRQPACLDTEWPGACLIHHSRRTLSSLTPCRCNTSGCERRPYNKEESFTSEFVFKKLFGPDFLVARHYWHIQPPVLPPPCVRTQHKCDVALNNIIGRGTFSEIALATLHVERQWRYVVLKEHYPDMVSKDHVYREAKMTMYLETTGYVPVCYGLVQDGIGGHSVVLELIGTGTTLSDVLGKVTPLKQHWLSIARQLAEGLSKIHEMDILINDVKADNVLVDLSSQTPVAKYCDFGCGTYRYGIVFTDPDMEQFVHLAPEVRAGGQTSKANDVYGLGRMLGQIVDVSGIKAIVNPCQRCMDDNPDLRISAAEASTWLNDVDKDVEDATASYSDPYISSGYGSASSSSNTSQSVHSTGCYCWNPRDARHQINVSSLNVLILLILMIAMTLHPLVSDPCC